MRQTVIALTIVLAACASASAEKTYTVSTTALPAPLSAPSGIAQTGFATGFEPGEGFVPGYIGGQMGWTAFAASTAQGHVATVNPKTGTQHLRISYDPSVSRGTLTGGFSPALGAQTLEPHMVSVDVAIGGTGGADYDVVPQAPTQGFLTARVKFSYLGDILVLDNPGSGLTYVDTGDNWVAGAYKNLTIEIDPIGDSLKYYYNGALIYTGVAGVFAGTTTEQVVLLSDNWHLSESGDFDNLVVTPEPGSLLLVALGALAGLRRR